MHPELLLADMPRLPIWVWLLFSPQFWAAVGVAATASTGAYLIAKRRKKNARSEEPRRGEEPSDAESLE
jgi:hypothetical protein